MPTNQGEERAVPTICFNSSISVTVVCRGTSPVAEAWPYPFRAVGVRRKATDKGTGEPSGSRQLFVAGRNLVLPEWVVAPATNLGGTQWFPSLSQQHF